MKNFLIALTLMFFLIASASAFAGTAEQSTDNIDTNIRITCFLQDMTLLGMLEAILRPKGLDYEITKEYVWISTKAKIKILKHKKEDLDAIKELRNKAAGIKVPLIKYTGADLRDVVLFLIKQTGLNIVVDEAIFSGEVSAPAAPAVAAQPTGPINTRVTCFLQDMTLLSVLEAILRPKGLDYEITKEYVWISTKAKIEKLVHKKEDLDAIKELRNKMNSIKVPLAKYKNVDLRDVVLFLLKQTGLNVVVDEAIFSNRAVATVAPVAKQTEGWGETYKKTTKPNQKTSAVSGLGFEILYYKINRSSYGTLCVVGEIKNNSGTAQGVEIQAIARDRSGKIVDSTTFYPASTRNIPVHSTEPINNSVTDRKDCATVTLKIIGTEKW